MHSDHSGMPGSASRLSGIRPWLLLFYDFLIFLAVEVMLIVIAPSTEYKPAPTAALMHILLFGVCMFGARLLFDIYHYVIRYGGSSIYIRLICADAAAGGLYYILQAVLPIPPIEFIRVVSIAMFNLLLSITMRLMYQFLYEYAMLHPKRSGPLWQLFALCSAYAVSPTGEDERTDEAPQKTGIAIVGAGRVGALLSEELAKNPRAAHIVRCFIDKDSAKIGRKIDGIPVISEAEATAENLHTRGVSEIVFALPQMDPAQKKALFEQYKSKGFRLKVYDYPQMQSTDGKQRRMRDFSIEELLFREPVTIRSENAAAFYGGRTVMITGGGGSIGAELCRQTVQLGAGKIVIVDVCENGAYDIQQELSAAYGPSRAPSVEILSVCDASALEHAIAAHRPDIILHAAAHKQVPLMEHSVCEAIRNNVFGTLNTVRLAVKYRVGAFVLISTDKAVNPTNVMGATKRMCEMIVQGHRQIAADTRFAIVRFGNVLGSAGSVIPLFRSQIAQGGPVTVTDKRIIRYFMTIPEAVQLVLEAGAMAEGNELFVLDMGKPVRILELAETLIRLSGFEPYRDIEIRETGLRPGEKLYEELLVRPDCLDRTENALIFVEREAQITYEELNEKLRILSDAAGTLDNTAAREALMRTIPTFRPSEEVNSEAEHAREMKMAK